MFERQSGSKVAVAAEDGQLLADHCIGLLRERGALIEHRVDARTKGTHAPAFDPGHLRVEFPLEGLTEGQERAEVGPTQLSRQRRDNLLLGKQLGKLNHSAEVLL